MSTQKHQYESECIAVPATEVARYLNATCLGTARPRSAASTNPAGTVSVRWNIEELRAWIAAGAPDLPAWERFAH